MPLSATLAAPLSAQSPPPAHNPLSVPLRLLGLLLSLLGLLGGCGGGDSVTLLRIWEASQAVEGGGQTAASTARIAMVADVAGIEDKGYNQSGWEGLCQLTDLTGAETAYRSSLDGTDFAENFEALAANGYQLCWGLGFTCADDLLTAAAAWPDTHFAVVDVGYEDTPPNVTGVIFRAQEPSFLVGYIAAAVSQTKVVGFVGGVVCPDIDLFQYGYMAGVAYANAHLGNRVRVQVDYVGDFIDQERGRSLALDMAENGCDVLYQAAGAAGLGVIAAAAETGIFAIGVDKDQASMAPSNVLTSALKKVDIAVLRVSEEFLSGEEIGGRTYNFGLLEGAVGIPEHHENYSDVIYDTVLLLEDDIMSGVLVPPGTEEAYQSFLKALHTEDPLLRR